MAKSKPNKKRKTELVFDQKNRRYVIFIWYIGYCVEGYGKLT